MPYKDAVRGRTYHNEYTRAWYKRNPQKRRAVDLQRNRGRKLAAVKLHGGLCLDCGMDLVTFPECADFDHLPERGKSMEAQNALKCSWETAVQELAKCELVCSNCHRKRTVRRRAAVRGSDA